MNPEAIPSRKACCASSEVPPLNDVSKLLSIPLSIAPIHAPYPIFCSTLFIAKLVEISLSEKYPLGSLYITGFALA